MASLKRFCMKLSASSIKIQRLTEPSTDGQAKKCIVIIGWIISLQEFQN